MGAEQKKVMMCWLIAVLCMMTASLWGPFEVFWAVLRHPPIAKSSLVLAEPAKTEFRRTEQQYFLERGIYIPLEDIMFVDQLDAMSVRYAKALEHSCSGLKSGNGVAIWFRSSFVQWIKNNSIDR